MKKLTTLLMLAPSAALAHGGHFEMASTGHDVFHAGSWIGLTLIAAAFLLARIRGQ